MKLVIHISAILTLLAGVGCAETKKEPSQQPSQQPNQETTQETQQVPLATHPVAMMNAAGLDQELMDRVVKFVEDNLKIEVKIVPAPGTLDARTLDEAAEELEALRPEGDVSLVALVKTGKEEEKHGTVRHQDQIAVLNATALKPAEADAEAYGRRLEKESIRCVALLAGMPPCVNPRCALWHYRDDAGLDRKGRNLCPPCYVRYEKLVKAMDAPAKDE